MDLEYCDFYYPAIVRARRSSDCDFDQPATVRPWLRDQIENSKNPVLARNMANGWTNWGGQGSNCLPADDPEQRRRLCTNWPAARRQKAQAAESISKQYHGENFMTGRCTWWERVGRSELLTLKALKLLKSADVVLHDDLIGSESSLSFHQSTEVQNVGKRLDRKASASRRSTPLMVQNALLWLQVVTPQERRSAPFSAAPAKRWKLYAGGIEF